MSAFNSDTVPIPNPLTREQILQDLLDLTKSLEAKTEIPNPRGLAGLHSLANFLLKELPALPKDSPQITASDIIFDFIEYFLKYMVSKDGTRAKQICDAISSLNLLRERRETQNSPSNSIP